MGRFSLLFEPSVYREIVLGKLNMLVKKFVKKICIKQGLGEKAAGEAGGKIFTFGSYRLGVHSAGRFCFLDNILLCLRYLI